MAGSPTRASAERGALGLLAALVVSCTAAPPGTGPRPVDPADPFAVAHRVVAAGLALPSPRSEAVIWTHRDDEGYRKRFQLLHVGVYPPPVPPEIRFDREIAIGASMGARGTGGWTLDVAAIRHLGPVLEVRLAANPPPSDWIRPPVATSPFVMAAVPLRPDVTEVVFILDGVLLGRVPL